MQLHGLLRGASGGMAMDQKDGRGLPARSWLIVGSMRVVLRSPDFKECCTTLRTKQKRQPFLSVSFVGKDAAVFRGPYNCHLGLPICCLTIVNVGRGQYRCRPRPSDYFGDEAVSEQAEFGGLELYDDATSDWLLQCSQGCIYGVSVAARRS